MTLPASYTTVDQVYERYPMMGSVTAITSLHVLSAIGAVQAKIDAVLSRRYAVPFDPLPPVIAVIAGDLVTLRLFETRVMGNPGKALDQAQAKEWTEQWRGSGKLLDQLAKGEIQLPSGSGTLVDQTASGTGEVWSNTSTTTPSLIGQDFADICPPQPRYWP